MGDARSVLQIVSGQGFVDHAGGWVFIPIFKGGMGLYY